MLSFTTRGKSSYLKQWFSCVLVLALLLPQASFAADPAAANATTPAMVPQQVNLTSYPEAVAYANRIIAQVKALKETGEVPEDAVIEAQIVHLEGQQIHPYYVWVLKYLSHAGIKVRGTLVREESYRQVAQVLMEPLPGWQELKALTFAFDRQQGQAPPAGLEPEKLEGVLKTGLRKLGDKLFGTPYGITFLGAFVEMRKGTDGHWWPWKWRFPATANLKDTAKTVTRDALIWIVGVRLLGGWFAREGVEEGWRERFLNGERFPEFFQDKFLSWEFFYILGIVGAFVYATLRLFPEIDTFRRQGREIKVTPGAGPGNQIEVIANDRSYLAGGAAQEWALNYGILFSQVFFGTAQLTLFTFLQKAWNGVFASFAYTPVEEYRGNLAEQARHIESTDPKGAKELDDRATWIGKVFWGRIYPPCVNLAQYLPGVVSNLPLIVLGTIGFVVRTMKRAQTQRIAREASSLEPALMTVGGQDLLPAITEGALAHCPDLLVLRAKLPLSSGQ